MSWPRRPRTRPNQLPKLTAVFMNEGLRVIRNPSSSCRVAVAVLSDFYGVKRQLQLIGTHIEVCRLERWGDAGPAVSTIRMDSILVKYHTLRADFAAGAAPGSPTDVHITLVDWTPPGMTDDRVVITVHEPL
jgi:hypothetical protein